MLSKVCCKQKKRNNFYFICGKLCHWDRRTWDKKSEWAVLQNPIILNAKVSLFWGFFFWFMKQRLITSLNCLDSKPCISQPMWRIMGFSQVLRIVWGQFSLFWGRICAIFPTSHWTIFINLYCHYWYSRFVSRCAVFLLKKHPYLDETVFMKEIKWH